MAVVLVTGGSSGIGLATVKRLAGAGHRVVAASRNPSRASYPDGVLPITFDVTDPEAAVALVTGVRETAGRIDVLVNNAGTASLGPLEESTDDEAHRIFEVNLFGPLRLARAVLPVMREQGGGHIVNVTSMNDVLPAPFGGWYSASKAAFASASVVLDAEVHAFGVFVTVVAPGLFRTEMSESLDTYAVAEGSVYEPVFRALMASNTALHDKAADPDVVAAAIAACIAVSPPPARVIVGTDAEAMSKLVHDTNPEDFAAVMRDFVDGLTTEAEVAGA
jgi:NAD(P)-dependent dehydrogenase (short-subunit alcohol dehydrogenase family)